jgi:hypothetical protein
MKKKENSQQRIRILAFLNTIAFMVALVFSYIKLSETKSYISLLDKKTINQNDVLRAKPGSFEMTIDELQK